MIITYYMTTTKLADTMKDKMANTAIGKSLSTVLNAPAKAVNGLFKVAGIDMDKALKSLPAAEREKELLARANKSRRSAIEVAFMCAAGFIALFPVWYLENHREGFLNTVDSWLHPKRTKEEKEAAALKPGDEPKESWWNLINARIIALAVVFGFDQTRDNIDSMLKHKHETLVKAGQVPASQMYKNMDTTLGWGLGNKIYDRMSPKTRGWLTRFFSGNMQGENIKLTGIQHETRGDVLQIINAPDFVRKASDDITELAKKAKLNPNDSTLQETIKQQIKTIEHNVKAVPHGAQTLERAVFAEQSRLFLTKEVLLTTILSVVIYGATKWPPAHKALSKIGLVKPHKEGHDNALDPTAAPHNGAHQLQTEASISTPGAQKKSWAKDTAPKSETKTYTESVKPSAKPEKSGERFVEQLTAKQDATSAQPSLR